MGLDGAVGSMQITWRRTPSAGEWTEDTSPPPSHSPSSSPSSLSSEEVSARRTVPSLDDPVRVRTDRPKAELKKSKLALTNVCHY